MLKGDGLGEENSKVTHKKEMDGGRKLEERAM
jgi:hypothetical protein